jgi:hypothetical protein
MESFGVLVDPQVRQGLFRFQAQSTAQQVGGRIPEDSGLLDEVTIWWSADACWGALRSITSVCLPGLIAVIRAQRYIPGPG